MRTLACAWAQDSRWSWLACDRLPMSKMACRTLSESPVGTPQLWRLLEHPQQGEKWSRRLHDVRFRRTVDQELSRLTAVGGSVMTPHDPRWRLRRPLAGVLRYRGTISTSNRVAIVGARRANHYGRHLAKRFAQQVVAEGAVVVSGGAIGVDITGHRSAMDAGGRTLVVLGSGLDYLAPTRHVRDFERVMTTGAVMSPFPLMQRPARWTYVARNEWIAGLADQMIVVQAGRRSGALHTARFALALGRTVWVVPGAFEDDLHSGCHALLSEGALPLTSETQWRDGMPNHNPDQNSQGHSANQCSSRRPDNFQDIWNHLSTRPMSLDELGCRVSYPTPVFLSAVASLEVSGWMKRTSHGFVIRAWPSASHGTKSPTELGGNHGSR